VATRIRGKKGEMLRKEIGSKVFFFEKKKQKTFDCLARSGCTLGAKVAKVFCFFFSKKKFFPYLSTWLSYCNKYPV
jgi:hypothetical protein